MKDTSIEDCLNDAPQETVPSATTSNLHNNHTDNNKGIYLLKSVAILIRDGNPYPQFGIRTLFFLYKSSGIRIRNISADSMDSCKESEIPNAQFLSKSIYVG